MAWDTSKLTPKVHHLVAGGAAVEAVAQHFGVPVEAVHQYMRKFDADGKQVKENGHDGPPNQGQKRKVP